MGGDGAGPPANVAIKPGSAALLRFHDMDVKLRAARKEDCREICRMIAVSGFFQGFLVLLSLSARFNGLVACFVHCSGAGGV